METKTTYSSTCDIILNVQHVTQGVVVLEHVEIKWRRIFANLGPHAVVRRSPAAGQDVVVSLSEVDQLGQGVIETTVEPDYQLELWV